MHTAVVHVADIVGLRLSTRSVWLCVLQSHQGWSGRCTSFFLNAPNGKVSIAKNLLVKRAWSSNRANPAWTAWWEPRSIYVFNWWSWSFGASRSRIRAAAHDGADWKQLQTTVGSVNKYVLQHRHKRRVSTSATKQFGSHVHHSRFSPLCVSMCIRNAEGRPKDLGLS